MQDQASPLEPSRDGTLFVSGFATSVRIERSHLLVRSGAGRAIQEVRLSRINSPQLRRLVVFGKGGSASFEALAWLHAIGCAFVHLSRDGDVLACSGGISDGQAALRRAQALAMDSAVGLDLTRYVLDAKVDGQRCVSESFNDRDVTAAIEETRTSLGDAVGSREAMMLEARAAVAYWDLWADEPMTFARADAARVPERWRSVGDRRSALSTTSPRNATTPAQACLNYG